MFIFTGRRSGRRGGDRRLSEGDPVVEESAGSPDCSRWEMPQAKRVKLAQICVLVVVLLGSSFLLLSIAHADSITKYLSSYVGINNNYGCTVQTPDNALGAPGADSAYANCSYNSEISYSLDEAISGVITITVNYDVLHQALGYPRLQVNPNVNAGPTDSGWVEVAVSDISSVVYTGTVGSLRFDSYGAAGFNSEFWLYGATLVVEGSSSGDDTCPTLENAHFAISDTTWLLDGTAVISPVSSTLTLFPGDIAAQNTTLQANVTYDAVVSVTQVSDETDLYVVLGQDNETLNITSAGLYTATFTTPANLAGPIIYGLENQGDGDIVIDFTCVSLASSSSTGEQQECIAPLNGSFENDQHWNWYRGAEFFYPGKYAGLPLADNGMIGSQETYTLPVLAEGEHLLLGFTARGLGDDGVIAGQVTNGSNTAEFNFSTYPTEYSYESSLDNLSDNSNIQFSFVNPGDVITGVVSSADVVVDNICVFTATRGPHLPEPTDPNGIPPVDIGFNYTSCDDVDGILAWFGINIQQYRAEYEAGASVWDPIGWVPWLIAAGWNILATWLCIFMAAFVTLIDLLEYILSSFLNIGNWLVRQGPLFVTWLAQWLSWGRLSSINITTSFGTFLTSWFGWVALYILLASGNVGLTLMAAIVWFAVSLANVSSGYSTFFGDLASWAGDSMLNVVNWIGQIIEWLANYFINFNGLRTAINWLIGGWNPFLTILGTVFSAILDDLAWLWNDNLRPFLNDTWSWLTQTPMAIVDLLISFLGAAWDLLKTMFWWLWKNIISVGHIPLAFYNAFDSSINSSAYSFVSCSGVNFWCVFLSGVQLINQVIAHTMLYPIVIVGIILSTLYIVWDNFKAIFSIEIK